MNNNYQLIFLPTSTSADLWGVVDEKGNLVVPPIYRSYGLLSKLEGNLVPAQNLNGHWGYLKSDGDWFHDFPLEAARLFTPDGISRYKRNGKWGYIRTDGEALNEVSYDEVASFLFGYGAVRNGDRWHYIDLTGKRINEETFAFANSFTPSGLAAVAINNGDKVGFINAKGEWVIKPQFENVRIGFNASGRAPVKLNKKWGIIDTAGNWVVEPTYYDLTAFDEHGLAKFSVSYAKGGVINDEGIIVLDKRDDNLNYLNYQPTCGVAKLSEWRDSFFSLKGGKEIANLNKQKLKLTSKFDEQCVAVTLVSGTDGWARLLPNGERYDFEDTVLEPYFNRRDEYTRFAQTDGKFVPVVLRNRRLAYVDRHGKIALQAETINEKSGDVLIMRNADGEELWRQSYPAETLIATNDHPVFLNPDHREFGYVTPSQASIQALIKKLVTEQHSQFDLSSLGAGKNRGNSFGTGEHLARAHYAYFDHAYDFHYAIEWPDFTGEFKEVKSILTELYGAPIESDNEVEDILRANNIHGIHSAVWRIDDQLLVLHDAYYEGGNVDYWGVLNLLLLPTK